LKREGAGGSVTRPLGEPVERGIPRRLEARREEEEKEGENLTSTGARKIRKSLLRHRNTKGEVQGTNGVFGGPYQNSPN